MDNLTHTLVGVMMARAGLRQGARHGTLMMALAANAPDLDLVAWSGGGVTFLDYHRGYTHAFASAPLLALIPMLLARVKFGWQTYLASLAGVLSHLLLDWTNVYGIRLLLPFSARWLRLDITDVVDPWILAALLLALAAPALAGMVSAEIGERASTMNGGGPKRGWAWAALAAILIYEGARYTAHDRAVAVMNARLYNGSAARRITAVPARFNPLRWRGIVEGDDFVTIVPVDLNAQFDPGAGRIDHSASLNPAIEAARQTREFRVLERFSQLPFWKSTPLPDTMPGATRVELIDLRFGTPEAPGFETVAIVDGANRVVESQLIMGISRAATRR